MLTPSFTSNSLKLTSQRHTCPTFHARRTPNTSPRASIGFELGDEQSRPPPDRQCDNLFRSASSLLLLTPILQKQPAKSFLELLLLIQKGSPESIMQKYGEFYRHIVSLPSGGGGGDLTWSDFLLDQLLSTSSSDSPFAKAAAKGENISHLLPAVTHDLDIIQKLAVPEQLLAEWVKESMKYGASISNDWLTAAASTTPLASSSSSSPPSPPPSSVVLKSSVIPTTNDPLPDAFLAPLTKEQRAALRADIAGRWRWSECAEELARYYATYGYGIVGGHRVLSWTGSSLQAQDVVQPSVHRLLGTEGKISPTSLGVSSSPSSSTAQEAAPSSLGGGKTLLLKSLSQFAEVSPENRGYAVRPPHTLLIGTSIERWLAFSWASNSQAVIAQRNNTGTSTSTSTSTSGTNNTRQKLVPTLRTVLLPVNQIDTLPQLLWALHNQPRGRFVVYLASLEGSTNDSSSSKVAEFVQMVSGLDGYSWPVNVMLVAGAEKEPCGDVVSVFEEMILLDRRQ